MYDTSLYLVTMVVRIIVKVHKIESLTIELSALACLVLKLFSIYVPQIIIHINWKNAVKYLLSATIYFLTIAYATCIFDTSGVS